MKSNIMRLLLACIVVFSFVTCKKSATNPNAAGAYSIILATPVQNGKLVTLNWSKLNNDSLMYYTVMKVIDTNGISEANPIQFTVGKDTTWFTDTLPLTPAVQYWIVGQTLRTSYKSNKVIYSRNDINFMNMYPMDALIDPTTQLLYITGMSYGSASGVVALYDLQRMKPDTTVVLGVANTGYCDLGTYNGIRELYVPSEDGNLYIYNAATLAPVGSILVATQLAGVVCSGNLLYLTGQTSGGDFIYVYNRGTQSLISKIGTLSNDRLRLIPGTNSSFIAVSDGNMDYLYNFDSNGNLLYEKTGIPGLAPNPGLFEVFPNGSGFVSGVGVVFNDSLTSVGSLPRGSLSYNSVCFDSTVQWIYAATTVKTIVKYSATTYNAAATYNTLGNPLKILYYKGSLLSVSSYDYTNNIPGMLENYTFIEQF